MGGKVRREIGSEIRKVTWMADDVPTMDILGESYGAFEVWGMAAGEV